MTVRTNQSQIIFAVIFRIAVDMIDFERHMPRHRMFFIPVARRTFIFIFLEKIAAEVRGNRTRVDADRSA